VRRAEVRRQKSGARSQNNRRATLRCHNEATPLLPDGNPHDLYVSQVELFESVEGVYPVVYVFLLDSDF
jgi:hypothetical protein